MKKNFLFLSAVFVSSTIFAQFKSSSSQWSVVQSGHVSMGIMDTEGEYSDNGSNNWTTIDINGDSKLDLVVTSDGNAVFDDGSNPYWEVYLNTGSGFSRTSTKWQVPESGLENLGINRFAGVAKKKGEVSWTTVDINGDSKPDLVLTNQYDTTHGVNIPFDQNTKPKWKVYLNTGAGFSANPIDWSVPKSGDPNTGINYLNGEHWYPGGHKWYTRDLNGDGKLDLVLSARYFPVVYRVNGKGSAPYWDVYLNTGSSFSSTALKWPVPEGGSDETGFNGLSGRINEINGNLWQTEDINGDSKPDLIVTGAYKNNYGQVVFGLGNTPYWKVYMNSGSGFSDTAINWEVPNGGIDNLGFNAVRGTGNENENNTWNFIDLDGDGKAEFVVTAVYSSENVPEVFGHGNSPHWKVYTNSGSAFSSKPSTWSVPDVGSKNGLNDIEGKGETEGFHRWKVMDINGDTKPDLVLTSVQGSTGGHAVFGLGSEPFWQVYYYDGEVLSINRTFTEEESVLVLYPNPSNSTCTIEWNVNWAVANISIFDLSGAEVLRAENIKGNSYVAHLNTLPKGVYLVQLKGENSLIQTKLIKE